MTNIDEVGGRHVCSVIWLSIWRNDRTPGWRGGHMCSTMVPYSRRFSSERHHQVGGEEFLMEEIGERHRGVDFGDEVFFFQATHVHR